MNEPTILLASASPRRKELLEAAGFAVIVRPTHVDESSITEETGLRLLREDARARAVSSHLAEHNVIHALTALARARAKADAAVAAAQDTSATAAASNLLILSADTTVVCDGRFLDKPTTRAEAGAMLRLLSGQAHHVYTALVMQVPHTVGPGTKTALPVDNARMESIVETEVDFAPLGEELIDWYLSSQEWRDVAGGYRIQERAGRFITDIHGSYSNVVGLPIHAVWAMVSRFRFEITSSSGNGS